MIPTHAITPDTLTHKQKHAGIGALIGSAVADALGAPFEFEPADLYAARFPQPVIGGRGEMIGGGSFDWAPGEFTDDTQMALAMAEAFLATNATFEPSTVWDHFVAWSTTANDIGNTTRLALSGSDYRTAAKDAHDRMGRSGSNGTVMRSAPLGLLAVRWGRETTIDIARGQSQLTHFDDVASWCSAVVAETTRALILGDTFENALGGALSQVDPDVFAEIDALVNRTWNRDELIVLNNGGALNTLAQAVWAIRTTTSFHDAVVAAINLGNDTDTVAAVCGGMAGALYGIQRIPARWVTYVHGTVRLPSGEDRIYHQHDLVRLAHQLLGLTSRGLTPEEPVVPATLVHEAGIHASNMGGAREVDPAFAVISLCRMENLLAHVEHRREFYIADQWGQGHNPFLGDVVKDAVDSIDTFLSEGRDVLVHCHGGRSRTGFILKAWYMRHHGVSHDDAHEWLVETWPLYADWNEDFNHFLTHSWEAK